MGERAGERGGGAEGGGEEKPTGNAHPVIIFIMRKLGCLRSTRGRGDGGRRGGGEKKWRENGAGAAVTVDGVVCAAVACFRPDSISRS